MTNNVISPFSGFSLQNPTNKLCVCVSSFNYRHKYKGKSKSKGNFSSTKKWCWQHWRVADINNMSTP